MNKEIKYLIIFTIVILALITRLFLLNIRPLHHDEGVNYFFADNILEGRGFKYDPLNYHGPSYFFILFASFLILGISEFSLRLPAAFFGIILVCLPLFLKFKEKSTKYLTAAFLLLSPSIMYYSRYSIHEILFVLSSFLAIYYLTSIINNKQIDHLPLLSASLAILLTTKETSIIILFILFIIFILNFKEIKKIDLRDKESIFWSIAIFLIIYITLFTSFFTNSHGIIDSFRGYFPWTERVFTEPGHIKPFSYYLTLLLQYELPLLFLSFIGIWYAFKNQKDIFARNIAVWLILSFFIYSFISYKTPWLIVNISVPMSIMAAIGVKQIKNIKIKSCLVILTLIYLSVFSFYLNFSRPWQSDNSFAYVHTEADILNLVKELNENYKPNEKILVVSDTYWPLPFYLNGKKVEYLDQAENLTYKSDYNYDIVKEDIFSKSNLPSDYKFSKYSLREGENLYLVHRK